MVSILAAICGIINIIILVFVAPVYATIKRLNLTKEPFSHLGDRKDTKVFFGVGLILLFILQLILCVGTVETFNFNRYGYLLLGISVVSGFIPAFLPPEKYPKVHSICGIIALNFAFLFSLFVNFNLYLFSENLGKICFLCSFLLIPAFGNYLLRRHSWRHMANGIEELLFIIPIILWNFCICSILLNL